jgi:hypothetical protein
MTHGELVTFFEHRQDRAVGERLPLQCPLTKKWSPRIYQHDKVRYGKHYWVCGSCQEREMDYANDLYVLFSMKRSSGTVTLEPPL